MTQPYADYAYYAGTYHGKLPEADFLRLSRQACAALDLLTFDRIAALTEERHAARVRDACCAATDVLYLNEQGGGIASETNDGISVNYIAGVSNTQTNSTRLYEAALTHLAMTGLLGRRC